MPEQTSVVITDGEVIKGDIVHTDTLLEPTTDKVTAAASSNEADRDAVELIVDRIRPDNSTANAPTPLQVVETTSEHRMETAPVLLLDLLELPKLAATETTPNETALAADETFASLSLESDGSNGDILDEDSPMEISDADLETIISQWKAEFSEPINDEAVLYTNSEAFSLDNPEGLPPNPPMDAELPAADGESYSELRPDVPGASVEIPAANVAPAVELITTQLATQVEMLEPEAAAEVHELLGELLQQIDELQQAVEASTETVDTSEDLPVVLHDTENAGPITESVFQALAEAAPIDTAELEVTLQRLCKTLGLEYNEDEIKQLVQQLVSTDSPKDKLSPNTELTPADWGTRESLQWFTSQLRTMRRQTNIWHSLIGRVGRSALASLASMQPA